MRIRRVKDHVTPEPEKIFKEATGSLLIDLGKEDNDQW